MTNQNPAHKVCPLKTIHPETPFDQMGCDKDRCAWYDKEAFACAVLSISRILDDIDSEGVTTREG